MRILILLPIILFFVSCTNTLFDPDIIQGCVNNDGQYIGYASVVGCSKANTVYYCKLKKEDRNKYKDFSKYYNSLEEFNNAPECAHTGGTTYKDYAGRSNSNNDSEGIIERLKDPPGLRDLSDRDLCINHFTNKANDDYLNEMLTDAAIEKRKLDCSVYAAEENNILLKKELNKKIKCWAIDDYVQCNSY